MGSGELADAETGNVRWHQAGPSVIVPRSVSLAPTALSPDLCRPAERSASADMQRLPAVGVIKPKRLFDLFRKLRWLMLVSQHTDTASDPPLGQLYEIEYTLRTLQACSTVEDSQLHSVTDLLIDAVQLLVWTTSRHWIPQRPESYQHILRRTSKTLSRCSDACGVWTRDASLSALLWLVSTLVVVELNSQNEDESDLSTPALVLDQVVAALGYTSYSRFLGQLSSWPWPEAWRTEQRKRLWSLVTTKRQLYPES